jgi:hypothetical protein
MIRGHGLRVNRAEKSGAPPRWLRLPPTPHLAPARARPPHYMPRSMPMGRVRGSSEPCRLGISRETGCPPPRRAACCQCRAPGTIGHAGQKPRGPRASRLHPGFRALGVASAVDSGDAQDGVCRLAALPDLRRRPAHGSVARGQGCQRELHSERPSGNGQHHKRRPAPPGVRGIRPPAAALGRSRLRRADGALSHRLSPAVSQPRRSGDGRER